MHDEYIPMCGCTFICARHVLLQMCIRVLLRRTFDSCAHWREHICNVITSSVHLLSPLPLVKGPAWPNSLHSLLETDPKVQVGGTWQDTKVTRCSLSPRTFPKVSESSPVEGIEGGGVASKGGKGRVEGSERWRKGSRPCKGGRQGGARSLVRRVTSRRAQSSQGAWEDRSARGPATHQRGRGGSEQVGIGCRGTRSPGCGPGEQSGVRGGEVGVRLQVDQQLLRGGEPLAAVVPPVHPVADVGTAGSKGRRGGETCGDGGGRRAQASQTEGGHLVRLHQLQVSGGQAASCSAHPGHVSIVDGCRAVGVLAVGVPTHAARHGAGRRVAGQAEAR